jgi:hypothetical protein
MSPWGWRSALGRRPQRPEKGTECGLRAALLTALGYHKGQLLSTAEVSGWWSGLAVAAATRRVVRRGR